MNRPRYLAAGAAAALVLAGCSSASAEEHPGVEHMLRLSHFMEPGHPHETCGVETLQEELEGTGIAVQSYPSAQLGGETEALEQVYTDNLEMSINGPSFLGVYHENFNVLDAGYLFDDGEALMEFQDSEQMDELMEDFYAEAGFKVFPGWYYGIRHTTADRPVESPEDLAGLNLRTPDAPLYRVTLGAMGANPTPMALGDLYMALQQGTVDGQENPAAIIDTQSFHEVQQHLSLTGHMVQTMHLSIAGESWEALSAEQQDALEEAIDVAGEAASECVFDQEQEILESYAEDEGFEVHEVDTEEFAQRVQDEMSQGYDYSDLYVEILQDQEGPS